MVKWDDDGTYLTKIASLLVLGLGLAALFAGVEGFWLVFVIGYAVVVPMVYLLDDWLELSPSIEEDEGDSESPSTISDPLAALRERYARGEIDEAEFERRVELLIETEDVSAAEARDRVAEVRGSDTDADSHRTEREAGFER